MAKNGIQSTILISSDKARFLGGGRKIARRRWRGKGEGGESFLRFIRPNLVPKKAWIFKGELMILKGGTAISKKPNHCFSWWKKFFGRRQKYASNEKDTLGMNRKMRNGARWTKYFPLSPSFVLNRYGLRTNSLMLLGLCLGWIFGILSFHKDKDVVFQLSFGLVNGLQVGIFSNIVYIHKVISRMNSWYNFKRNDVITAGEKALSLGFWFLSFRSNTKGHEFDLLEKPLSFMLTWENSWHHWFPGEMTSEKQAQKFHTDEASLPRSG